MKFILDLVDRLSGPGKQAASVGQNLASSLTSAASASGSLDSATATSASSVREMYGELEKAEGNLKRLEAAQKKLGTGGAVDVAQWRTLQAEIDKTKGKIGAINQSIVSAGGAGFDVKGYDKAEADKRKAADATAKAEEKARAAKEKGDKKSVDGSKAAASKSSSALLDAIKKNDSANNAIGTIAKTALAGVGVAAAGSLLNLGLGYQGVARLNGILFRAQYNFRGLFKGTDPKPLLDSVDKLVSMLSPATKTGAALGGLLRGSFNAVGRAIEAVTPFVERFFAGMIIGGKMAKLAFTYVEVGILKLITAIPGAAKLVAKFGTGWGPFAAGAMVAGAALGVIAVKAAIAMAPLVLMAAAATALSAALEDLSKSWDDNSLTQISNKLKTDLGLASADETNTKRQGIVTGDDYDKKHKLGKYAEPAGAPPTDPAASTKAGVEVGAALGAGMIAGMNATGAGVAAAGAALATAAEAGAKKEAVIRSPSDKMKRRVGMQLGAGVIVGLEASADGVQKAAEEALVPDVGGMSGAGASGPGTGSGGAAAGGSGGGGRTLVIDARGSTFYGIDGAGGLVRLVRTAMADQFEEIREQVGALAEEGAI